MNGLEYVSPYDFILKIYESVGEEEFTAAEIGGDNGVHAGRKLILLVGMGYVDKTGKVWKRCNDGKNIYRLNESAIRYVKKKGKYNGKGRGIEKSG